MHIPRSIHIPFFLLATNTLMPSPKSWSLHQLLTFKVHEVSMYVIPIIGIHRTATPPLTFSVVSHTGFSVNELVTNSIKQLHVV